MAQIKKKQKLYKGKNVRISDSAFDKIKSYVDVKGLKLGRFVEDTVMASLNNKTQNNHA